MDQNIAPCPFIYADGHRCAGVVCQVRAYGPARDHGYIRRDDVRKFRLWCSDGWDHAGAVSGFASKQRMEFYPDDLVKRGIYDQVVGACPEIREEKVHGSV